MMIPATIRLFHGTSHAFDAFAEEYVGAGGDANSALGVHLIESPSVASDYAGLSAQGDVGANASRVLVAEVSVAKVLVVSLIDDFFGAVEGEPFKVKQDFANLRTRLRAEGYDAVTIDVGDDTAGTWVILNPKLIRVVGRLSISEASEAEDATIPRSVKYISGELFPGMYDEFTAGRVAPGT